MSREPFEAMTDVMDTKQLAEAPQISKAGACNLLSSPDFPTLRIGGCKLVKRLTALYSEERKQAAREWAKQNGIAVIRKECKNSSHLFLANCKNFLNFWSSVV